MFMKLSAGKKVFAMVAVAGVLLVSGTAAYAAYAFGVTQAKDTTPLKTAVNGVAGTMQTAVKKITDLSDALTDSKMAHDKDMAKANAAVAQANNIILLS